MAEERIYIEIIDLTLSEKYWTWERGEKHMSHHCHRGSAYETDDSCGNCNGSLCEICREVQDPPHMECGIQVDIMEDMMVQKGSPRDIARKICTSDFGWREENYVLRFPTDGKLEDAYPEFYNKCSTMDEELRKVIFNNIDTGNYTCLADLERMILSKLPLTKEAHYHLKNQIRMIFEEIRSRREKGSNFNDVINNYIIEMKSIYVN